MKHIFFIIIILVVSLFTGCMMMGGMMHKMQHDEHKETSNKLIKEVEIHNYRITAEFPPLFYYEEAVFRIKIYSLNDSMASTASIRLMISEIGNEKHSDTVQFNRDLYKDSGGNYSDTYLVKTKKDLKITYAISGLEGVVLKKPIEIEAERVVHIRQKQTGMCPPERLAISRAGMHVIGPYAIVGGIVMVTMMVIMIGRVL